MKSFRYELIILAIISLILAFLSEGIIVFVFCWIMKLLNKDPVSIEGAIEYSNSRYFIYRNNTMNGMQQNQYLSVSFILGFVVFILVTISLFTVCYFALLKKYSLYLKEISLGIQEISLGNFEHQISIVDNDELGMIAQQLNVMSNEIYILLKDERKNEDVKNELITSVAHDLRTPLTSIIGYLYLALTKEELEEEKKKRYIEIAYDKSKRLEKLLEDLFRYTKYSTDEVRIQNQPIDFVKFMEQMMEEFYPNFQDAGLMYEFHTEIDKAYIMADGELLARAVGNLVSNAIKYGKDGKIIKVYIKQCANYVSLSILNYGPLIPQENLAHIFERFYRVENSRSEQTGGSGLGLAIAKQIVTLHNGEIDVKSDYDGTVFEVRLKLSQNSGENSYEDKK